MGSWAESNVNNLRLLCVSLLSKHTQILFWTGPTGCNLVKSEGPEVDFDKPRASCPPVLGALTVRKCKVPYPVWLICSSDQVIKQDSMYLLLPWQLLFRVKVILQTKADFFNSWGHYVHVLFAAFFCHCFQSAFCLKQK